MVDVVQGTGPRGLLVTLYFDQQSGLLLRELRYGISPIGRVPTQIDFGDYREVNGIKLPFRITYAWLDGRDSIVLNEIQTNVPVDEAKFGRPAPLSRDNQKDSGWTRLEPSVQAAYLFGAALRFRSSRGRAFCRRRT